MKDFTMTKTGLKVTAGALGLALVLVWTAFSISFSDSQSISVHEQVDLEQLRASERSGSLLLAEKSLGEITEDQSVSSEGDRRSSDLGIVSIKSQAKSKAQKSNQNKQRAKDAESEYTEESREKRVTLRMRILSEAEARARHSETAWIDLAEVAHGYHRIGMSDDSLRLLRKAAKLTSTLDSPAESGRRMRDVVKAASQMGRIALAQSFLNLISHRKYRDLAIIDVAKAFTAQRQYPEARELILTAHDVKIRHQGLRSLAEKELQAYGVEDALATLRLMNSQKAFEEALVHLSGVLSKKGQAETAMSFLPEIKNFKNKDRALARIAAVSPAKKGNFEAAISLIKDPFFKDFALSAVVEKEASRRRLDLANVSIQKIKSPEQQVRAQEAVVNLQIQQGEISGALGSAQQISEVKVRRRAIQSVAIAEVKKHGSRAARKTADLIDSSAVRETTLRKIAQRAAAVGEGKEAIETIHFIQHPAERAMAYAEVALAQARYGDDPGARFLAQEARQELSQVTDRGRGEKTSGLIAEVYGETGEFETALYEAASIQNKSIRDRTYQKLALQFAKSRDPFGAEQSASLIERKSSREKALDSVVKTLARSISPASAFEVVNGLKARRQQVRFLVAVAARA